MNAGLTRDQLRRCLVEAYEPLGWTDALWEAGSAAFGREDEYSDIDLALQVEPGRREEAFTIGRAALEELSPIDLEWRVPEPAWHGHSQAFWRLERAGEFLFVDLCAIERGSKDRFLQPERHGGAVALFDKGDWVKPEPLDQAALAETLAARIEQLRLTFPLFISLVKKEVARGRSLEAAGYWQGHVLRPLIALLRIRWSPARHDFAYRLIHEDLPAEVVAELEPLAWPPGPESLEERLRAAESLFQRTLSDLDS